MSETQVLKGSATLRPRARLIRTIGRDLISNQVVALVELIKNCYDADANHVRIVFEEPLEPSQGGILIEDDGMGMNLDVIKKAWFEPATVSKTRDPVTPGGRRVTGEKGIGRFAAARIAQAMDLETVAKGRRRLVRVRFDWGRFDDETLYLDEVKCRWEEGPVPRGRRHGTRLNLSGLNEAWDDKAFSHLRGELSRLVSPNRGGDEFEISLVLPERFKEYAGTISSPPILGKPHYRLVGGVDSKGQLEAEYTGPNGKKPEVVHDKVILSKGRTPASGPFRFEFRVWDRDSLNPLADELGSTVRRLREDLNSACGISIYRDDFRVLLAGNDWLGLDLRRVQNPTMRLSNNQVVGAVYITADENRGLRDQSNREGIVSSSAFDDFKDAVVNVLTKLEVKRDTHRRALHPRKPAMSLFEALDIAPLRDYIEKRYPGDTELKKFIGEKTRVFDHGVSEVQQVLARYRRLATLGQIIDVVLHDGRTPVAAISNEAALAIRDIRSAGEDGVDAEALQRRLATITQQAQMLSELFRRLSPFSGRKRGRPSEIAIEKIIAETFELFDKPISDLHVKVSLPDGKTMITADQAEMQQIFVNLLQNALYWLEKVDKKKREISVRVSTQPGEMVVLFSDNGPGVPEDVRERIFDPYFSTKPDGVGLGLTIAGETADEYNGALELIAGGPLGGATFRVTLRKRIGA